MVNTELPNILDFLRENLRNQIFSLKVKKKVFLALLEKKKKHYNELKENISSKWQDFKNRNQKRVVRKTYTTFLYENFHNFFEYYLNTFFGFDCNSLELKLKEKISETNLVLEYNYYLSPKEIGLYEKISNELEGNLYGTLFFTGYMSSVIKILGIIIKRLINEKILISLDCGIIKEEKEEKYLSFLIIVREDKKEIFNNYICMTLYYFLKQFKNIPDEYYEKLLVGREKLYKIALNEYGPKEEIKEKIADLLFYFYKKCKLLQNFCPLLDFLNFVCSRVEDSIFNKIDVIKKSFLENFNYSVEKKNSLIQIFKFVDKQSTLYSTFFANNLPGQKAQFNLFLLYMKYYFGGGNLETLEVSNILFLPEVFKNILNQYNKNAGENAIYSNTIKDIEKFITSFNILSNKGNIDLFFKIIFNKGVSQMNYKFFRSFLKSFNKRFLDLIDMENKIIAENTQNEPLTFNIVVDHICRMLFVLIEKIFLRDNPDDASKNFIDPRGRYIGKNIALRVLELFIYQEINYSDDIWDEILISLTKDKVRKELEGYVNIPDKHFYSEKDLTKITTIYNLQSFFNASYLEEWLINEIIIPLNNFIAKVRNSIKNPSNEIEIYEKLSEIVLKDIKIEDKKTIKELKFACQQLAQFWKIPN